MSGSQPNDDVEAEDAARWLNEGGSLPSQNPVIGGAGAPRQLPSGFPRGFTVPGQGQRVEQINELLLSQGVSAVLACMRYVDAEGEQPNAALLRSPIGWLDLEDWKGQVRAFAQAIWQGPPQASWNPQQVATRVIAVIEKDAADKRKDAAAAAAERAGEAKTDRTWRRAAAPLGVDPAMLQSYDDDPVAAVAAFRFQQANTAVVAKHDRQQQVYDDYQHRQLVWCLGYQTVAPVVEIGAATVVGVYTAVKSKDALGGASPLAGAGAAALTWFVLWKLRQAVSENKNMAILAGAAGVGAALPTGFARPVGVVAAQLVDHKPAPQPPVNLNFYGPPPAPPVNDVTWPPSPGQIHEGGRQLG